MYLIFSSEATFESFTDEEEGQHYTEEGTCIGRAKAEDKPLILDPEITIGYLTDKKGRIAMNHRFSDMEIAEIETRWEWYFDRGYMVFDEQLPGDWEIEGDDDAIRTFF